MNRSKQNLCFKVLSIVKDNHYWNWKQSFSLSVQLSVTDRMLVWSTGVNARSCFLWRLPLVDPVEIPSCLASL